MYPQENIQQQTRRYLEQFAKKSEVKSFVNGEKQFVVSWCDCVSSTMDITQKFDVEMIGNRVFVFGAEEQMKGKGQRQNSWQSPKGNLYITILTEAPLDRISMLSILLPSEICRLFEEAYKLKPTLKWMNDICVNGTKIGGVLVRNQIIGNKCFSELGIGININNAPIEGSTCLSKQTGMKEIDEKILGEKLAISIAHKLKNAKDTSLETFQHYNKNLQYLNQNVNIWDVTLTNILASGIFVGVNKYGFAELLIDGEKKQMSEGRMRLKE